MKQAVLHPENLLRVPFFGEHLVRYMEWQAELTRKRAAKRKDPDVSVVIRSRNNVDQLVGLFADIAAQDFNGKVEVIVVDTQSTDGTVELAKGYGAKVISICQKDFSYPKALNLGFEAATANWIFSFVDHSALVHTQTLRIATRWSGDPRVAGAWALPLPNSNATSAELLGYTIAAKSIYGRVAKFMVRGHEPVGMMGANAAVYRKDIWPKLGKFDLSYGAGGEDTALGLKMIREGYKVAFDPAMTVYHTHGLGFLQSLRQLRYWRNLNKPLPFNHADLRKFRGKQF
jgi:glycosyltransferase involved in cell wall biosynthesis